MEILNRLAQKQTFGGLLYLGKNEKVAGIEDYYTKVPGFDCLYQAINQNNSRAIPSINQKPNDDVVDNKNSMPTFVKPKKLFERPTISSLLKH